MRVTDNLQKISMREELYHMEGSSDYVPVVFREHEAAAALATAIKAQARLHWWDSLAHCWNLVYMLWKPDVSGLQCGTDAWKECGMFPRCRYDCLYERTGEYFDAGAGTVLLPERLVVDRWNWRDDKPLPPCPLDGYGIYSEADHKEIDDLLHEMAEHDASASTNS